MTREVAPGPFRSFWIRIFPFFEPKPPATQSSSASRSTRAWWVAKCQVSRERFWIETYSSFAAWLDEELGDRVRVGARARARRGVLLDQREPRALLGDDEQPPEERAAVDRARDPHVERLLEHDALRHVDEQAVLPDGGVVRGELLVPADERVEPRVVLGERLEADALGRADDLDPAPR